MGDGRDALRVPQCGPKVTALADAFYIALSRHYSALWGMGPHMEKMREEYVFKHAGIATPFVVLDDRVLDLSEFLERHPGGSAVLLANLGRDVTADFRHVLAHAHRGVLRTADTLAV